MIFTIVYFVLSTILTIICALFAITFGLITRPFSKKLSILIVHSTAKFWGRKILKMAFISFNIEGKENYNYKKTYILTINHQSAFDIFCCFYIFKGLYAFVSKDTYGKVPFVGFGMKLSNYIFVKRGTVGAVKSIDDMEDRLKNNTSIVIYPEGTRSKDGEIRMPKRGILKIAERCNDIDVLPVVLYGTKDIMVARGFRVNPFRKIRVRILPSFNFNKIEGDENTKLKYWYDIINKNYNELKNN